MQIQERGESIKQLAELIRGVNVAMFTTVSADGRLVSRPLGTHEVEFDGDLWFATAADSPKVAEIAADSRVNVCLLYTSRCVGETDPNLRLIHVRAESAEYWDGPGGLLGKALYFVMTAVTDDPGSLSDNRVVDLK
ncbi:pyridoxamine 5'-phosphate oxidase family protein [Xanthomonas campestris]|uniref:pyridoxamine 5'-phosphate oxidase family protein n=1 Tax=Xanthomonas campestris TaxID=339 RepID=UPI000E1F2A19|nr:pyridoxamine 5'-phosphate oxidase family protein [Xanthomonas campestris]